MQAMILAAGRGERLRPLTDTTPKPLLQAGPHRLIEHHLLALADAGIRDVVINVAHLAGQIMDTLGDGRRYGVSIRYSDESGCVLETGGGIHKALPLLRSDPFMVINGDVWTDMPLDQLPTEIDTLAHLVLVDNPAHNPDGDFGLDGHCVTAADRNSKSWTFSGIGVYRHRLFDGCTGGRFPLAGLLRSRFADCEVSGQTYSGEWMDIGTAGRLRSLSEKLLAEGT